MSKTYLIAFCLVLIVGSGAFFAGMKYQQSKSSQVPTGNFGAFGQRSGRNGQNGQNGQNAVRPISGEILSADDKSITVKLQDGSSKIVLLTGTTIYSKSANGAKTDLKVGDRVAAVGTANSDGSVTAANVQINPIQRNATPSGQPGQ